MCKTQKKNYFLTSTYHTKNRPVLYRGPTLPTFTHILKQGKATTVLPYIWRFTELQHADAAF